MADDYERVRNGFIRKAKAEADKLVPEPGDRRDREEWRGVWNRTYLKLVDAKVAEYYAPKVFADTGMTTA